MPFVPPYEVFAREEGKLEGQQEAAANITIRQARKRFPEFTETDETVLRPLPLADMESFGEALLDFVTIDNLRQWLAARRTEA